MNNKGDRRECVVLCEDIVLTLAASRLIVKMWPFRYFFKKYSFGLVGLVPLRYLMEDILFFLIYFVPPFPNAIVQVRLC